jgi:hypothetical protein
VISTLCAALASWRTAARRSHPRRLWMNEGVSAAKTFLFPLIGRQSEAGGR